MTISTNDRWGQPLDYPVTDWSLDIDLDDFNPIPSMLSIIAMIALLVGFGLGIGWVLWGAA